jgi:hypothetical protein
MPAVTSRSILPSARPGSRWIALTRRPTVAAVILAACMTPRPQLSPVTTSRDGDARRFVVATTNLSQLPPFTIEVRDDGWISITKRNDQTGSYPRKRLLVRAADISDWTAGMRTYLDTRPPDSVATRRQSPALGHGRMRMMLTEWGGGPRRNSSFTVGDCGHLTEGSGPSETVLRAFFALLDSAASIAPRTTLRPDPARVHYGSEVSCPALAVVGSPRPVFPGGIPAGQRRAVAIGVRVVVGPDGRVERGTFAALPGQDPRLVRAARALMEDRQFEPAEWDGLSVRQLVHEVITFEPPGEAGPDAVGLRPARDAASATSSTCSARGSAALVDSTRTVYEAAEVTCAATLPWVASPSRTPFGPWERPAILYPASLAATRTRTEVLASYVVDAEGRVDLSTVSVMPDADARVVSALPEVLARLTYRPATRDGRAVKQRVVQVLLFEPPAGT